ncbi:uncharacterized protein PFL1_02078 [Pseudozyma flocculosa PF-1]|uniref:Uncharacterized protein n=1 Tax=Pseudozyma flocculosa TaxID=84751 RepID=A0A5C3EZE2_9BASI|nr:uncharacterized protein PFL1_02078 [Pseudozyma flocculosa PF-1]EPQ30553.1 hypothetical protein PFL1_02078 [Pseudozyma flocculosa PF-1]SPO37644.1 uncharacterized protein PSFLO_03120 [Pseudozyma flocculosa]
MKVKLRVPLASTPRQTASPLSNARGPDEMDEDDAASPQQLQLHQQQAALAGTSEPASEDDDDEDDEEVDEEDEGDELDELDELEDEMPAPPATTSNQVSPKRSRITVKPRAPKGHADAASPSPTPSSNAREGGSTESPRGTPSERARILTGKRAAAARQEEAARMTKEELDALPAAKRRKSHKARGAPGPGRGWRKGLTKGQKPVYELPASALPEAGSTPTTFGNTTSSARASPQVGRSGGEGSGKRAAQSAAVATVKIQDASGTRTHVSDLSAKAGTAKNPGFRYPPLPSSRGGPPILPISKIPITFQASASMDKKKEPRTWNKGKREFLSLGGRLWSVPTWYGGEDRGFEKKIDPTIAPLLAQSTTTNASLLAAANAAKGTPTPTPAPGQAAPSTPSAGRKTGATSATTASAAAAASRLSPDKATERSETPLSNAGGARRATTTTGTVSPLPPPRHIGAVREDVSWRGQSPAFLAGGR